MGDTPKQRGKPRRHEAGGTFQRRADEPAAVGYAQFPPQHYGAPASTAKNWMGITALVLSLASLVGTITWVGGLIFGYKGLAAAKRGEASNRGLALAAVIIGWVGAALTVLGIAGLILYIAIAGDVAPG